MVRALLDACVLYPTVLRQILLEVAGRGLFVPLWSDRILEEWARAAARGGDAAEVVARGEVAVLRARWPNAAVRPDQAVAARLWLPDADDIHVLAAAIAGSANAIVTFNARDFPRQTLADEGVSRLDPDQMMLALFASDPDPVRQGVLKVAAEARRLSGQPLPLRPLLKRAGLPRLGRLID